MSKTIFSTDNPQANVIIVHGMQEHHERYVYFAQFLKNAGYKVTTFDLLGHGHDAKMQGHIDGTQPYLDLIRQIVTVIKSTKIQDPDLPIYLIGHSMGSILVRDIVSRNQDYIDKVVLIGTPPPNPMAGFGLTLCHLLSIFKKRDQVVPFLEKMIFNTANKMYPDLGWLCKNQQVVEDYKKDPLCGNPFTLNYYIALFSAVKDLSTKQVNITKKTLPIHFFVGSDDPIVEGEKGLKKSINMMRRQGFTNIDASIYPGLRHELLNEASNIKIFHDILNFLNYND